MAAAGPSRTGRIDSARTTRTQVGAVLLALLVVVPVTAVPLAGATSTATPVSWRPSDAPTPTAERGVARSAFVPTTGAGAATGAGKASGDGRASGAIAVPERVTLGFEEIPGAGPTEHRMAIHEQYADPDASYGVTFVPPDGGVDYGAEVVECGRDFRCDAAPSGSMVAATPGPGSGCDVCPKHPMRVRFAALQKEVSVRVTHEGTDADFTAVATMTAYAEDGRQLDTERVEFPSDGGWQTLSVGNPYGSARIASVQVAGGKTGTSPYANTILVDDLTFEAEPPDAGADTEPPDVKASSHHDGDTIGYGTAGTGVDVRFISRDDSQLRGVSYRVDGGPPHLLCGTVDDLSHVPCPTDRDLIEDVPVPVPQTEGTHEIVARACDLAGNCATDTVTVTVALPPPASITGMDPAVARLDVVLRDSPREVIDGTDEMTLRGSFHDRTAVWLFGGCTVGEFPDYCAFRYELPASAVTIAPNGSVMTLDVPTDEIPDRHLRSRRFFWGVYDEVRGHPGDDSFSASNWAKSPEFTFRETARYPQAHGFEFTNRQGDSGAGPFQGTYGKVAFGCIPRTDACVPRPLYFTIWLPVYRGWLDKSGGSCVGMASTSQLLYRTDEDFSMIGQPNELEPESFDPDASYAAGLQGVGSFEREPPKPSRYAKYPRRPRNLMGVVRSNHGVQTSTEFLEYVIRDSGGAVDTPAADVLRTVRDDPTAYVLCLRSGKSGHCVTPYAVRDVNATGSRILVYDNNFPQEVGGVNTTGDAAPERWDPAGQRFVEIDTATGRWRYPRSFTTNPADPKYADWNGSGGTIYVVPLDVWEGKRHAVVDLVSVGTEFRTVARSMEFVFGGADPLYATPDGGRWGWRPDGTFVDEMPTATATPPLGQPAPDNRVVPLFIPADAGAPKAVLNVRGDAYTTHSSRPGLAFQVSVADAEPGDADTLAARYRDGRLAGVEFGADTDRDVTVRMGEQYGDADDGQEVALTLARLAVEGDGAVAVEQLDGDRRGYRFENDAGHTARYHLVVRTFDASGDEPRNATVVLGPFAVPDAATQTVTLVDWPASREVSSAIDADRDGSVDDTRSVAGQPCNAGILAADLDANGIPDQCEPADVDGAGGVGAGDGTTDRSVVDRLPAGGLGLAAVVFLLLLGAAVAVRRR